MRLYGLTGCSVAVLLSAFTACTSTSNNTNDEDSSTSGSGGSGGSETSAGSNGSGSGGTESNTASGGNSGSGASGGTGGEAGAAGAPGDDAGGSGGSGASSGTGGSDATGGSGGTGGTGTTGPTEVDSCEGSQVEPNEDRDSATPYQLGWEFPGCLQDEEDFDWYEFTTPDDDRGGVVTVRITDVGPEGDINVTAWSALDNGEFHSTGSNTDGGSVFFYFNAQPASTFRLEVTNYLNVDAPNPYLLTVTYTEVPDEHEPNDTRPAAALIEVGEDVEGYSFAGWENSTSVPDEAWYDWYEIELEAGATSFLVDVVASDIDTNITLYDGLGSEITDEGTNTEGSSVLLEYEIEEAGTYYLRVNPYLPPGTKGNTTDPPEYAVTPYTLTVTQ